MNPKQVLKQYVIWSMLMNPDLAQLLRGGRENKVICDNSHLLYVVGI